MTAWVHRSSHPIACGRGNEKAALTVLGECRHNFPRLRRATIDCMVRRLVLCLLIALLPLQGTHASIGLLQHASGDVLHWAAHDRAVDHHHGADGSVHHDDSDDSKRHVMQLDVCHGVAVPRGAIRPAFLPAWAQAPATFHSPFASDPVLKGLERPPRALG